MTRWTMYPQAADLPASRVEKMWRALDRIAEACERKHPADPEFMTKDEIRALCLRAMPQETDEARGAE